MFTVKGGPKISHLLFSAPPGAVNMTTSLLFNLHSNRSSKVFIGLRVRRLKMLSVARSSLVELLDRFIDRRCGSAFGTVRCMGPSTRRVNAEGEPNPNLGNYYSYMSISTYIKVTQYVKPLFSTITLNSLLSLNLSRANREGFFSTFRRLLSLKRPSYRKRGFRLWIESFLTSFINLR